MSAQMKNAEVFKASDDMKTIGMAFFYVLVFLGLMAVIVGLLGAVTAKCHGRCCSCCVSIDDECSSENDIQLLKF